eukprot:1160563-Pelagomonas_calceolata.AAC.15
MDMALASNAMQLQHTMHRNTIAQVARCGSMYASEAGCTNEQYTHMRTHAHGHIQAHTHTHTDQHASHSQAPAMHARTCAHTHTLISMHRTAKHQLQQIQDAAEVHGRSAKLE